MADKTIDGFNLVTTLADGDKVPLWQVSSGATKRISVADIVLYLESALDLSDDYLLRDGSVAMLAALDMGGFAITNVGNVDGVDVSALSTAHTALDAAALKKDGSVALTGNWDIGASRKIQAERIEARSNAGLKLYEDGGLGIDIADSTGYVGLNTTAPVTRLHVAETATASTRGLMLSQHNSGAQGALNKWRKSRGTLGSPTIVVDGDYVGVIQPEIYDGNSYENAGLFGFIADGTVSDGVVPAAFIIATTATNGDGTERIRVKPDGKVGIGITAPDSLLHVHAATAGSVAAPSGSNLVVESNTTNRITMLAPDGSIQVLTFGKASDNDDGQMWYDHTNDEFVFAINNQARVRLASGNSWEPTSNDGQSLGSSSNKWSQVYATIGTINTSDIRQKKSVEPSDLGLEFIRALEPIKYVLDDMERPAVIEKRVEKRAVTQKQLVDQVVYERNTSGKMIRKTVQAEIDVPVYEEIPLFHPNGKPLMESRKVKQIDAETGKEVEVEERFQAVQRIPIYEDVEVEYVRSEAVKHTYKRPHYGLSSQQVKQAMDRLGVDDFGGYIHDEAADFYGLRMDEFTSPMIKAIQQLADRMDLAGI